MFLKFSNGKKPLIVIYAFLAALILSTFSLPLCVPLINYTNAPASIFLALFPISLLVFFPIAFILITIFYKKPVITGIVYDQDNQEIKFIYYYDKYAPPPLSVQFDEIEHVHFRVVAAERRNGVNCYVDFQIKDKQTITAQIMSFKDFVKCYYYLVTKDEFKDSLSFPKDYQKEIQKYVTTGKLSFYHEHPAIFVVIIIAVIGVLAYLLECLTN